MEGTKQKICGVPHTDMGLDKKVSNSKRYERDKDERLKTADRF